MPERTTPLPSAAAPTGRWVLGGLLGGLIGAGAALLLPGTARAEVLYRLDTRCSVRGAAPQACVVEASDAGEATLYRHRIGSAVTTIRVRSNPVRMQVWREGDKSWEQVRRAEVRFSTNTVCFNGGDLCVVNPNYLNSVREERPDLMSGRDLVKVHFGQDGRVDASCFDDGCGLVLK